MKRNFPLLIICLGILLILGGFMYDVMFAGIPYQDPSAEMTADTIAIHKSHPPFALSAPSLFSRALSQV